MSSLSVDDILDALLRFSRIDNEIALGKRRQGDVSGYTYHVGRRDALRQARDLLIDTMAGRRLLNEPSA